MNKCFELINIIIDTLIYLFKVIQKSILEYFNTIGNGILNKFNHFKCRDTIPYQEFPTRSKQE